MPWYYAGPEAKPVGPVSAEQLQGLLASGTITPETFVIEHTGPGATNLAWKRYREAFTPAVAASLPPIPPAAPAPFHPATVTPPPPPTAAAHPLFPSALSGHPTQLPPAQPYPYVHGPIRPTNSWCAWALPSRSWACASRCSASA